MNKNIKSVLKIMAAGLTVLSILAFTGCNPVVNGGDDSKSFERKLEGFSDVSDFKLCVYDKDKESNDIAVVLNSTAFRYGAMTFNLEVETKSGYKKTYAVDGSAFVKKSSQDLKIPAFFISMEHYEDTTVTLKKIEAPVYKIEAFSEAEGVNLLLDKNTTAEKNFLDEMINIKVSGMNPEKNYRINAYSKTGNKIGSLNLQKSSKRAKFEEENGYDFSLDFFIFTTVNSVESVLEGVKVIIVEA